MRWRTSSSRKFILQPSVTNDYVLLKLKQEVKGAKDFLPLSPDVSQIWEKQLVILGYPEAENYRPINLEGDILKVDQFGTAKTGRVRKINKEKAEVQHQVSTLPGQSGTSIILNDNGKPKIVGIHKGGVKEEQINIGRVMTSELIATLEAEASRMGAVSFKVDSQPAKEKPPQPNPKPANNSKPQPEVSQSIQIPPVKPVVSKNSPNTNSQGQKKEEELRINVKK